MKNKGFTMVELLAAVTILGILSIVAVIAYTKYLDYSKNKAYDTLAKAAYTAASEYIMDYPLTTEVTLNKLVEDDYLENANDPSTHAKCTNSVVEIEKNDATDDSLEEYKYKVVLCCNNYKYEYSYPTGGKHTTDKCD